MGEINRVDGSPVRQAINFFNSIAKPLSTAKSQSIADTKTISAAKGKVWIPPPNIDAEITKHILTLLHNADSKEGKEGFEALNNAVDRLEEQEKLAKDPDIKEMLSDVIKSVKLLSDLNKSHTIEQLPADMLVDEPSIDTPLILDAEKLIGNSFGPQSKEIKSNLSIFLQDQPSAEATQQLLQQCIETRKNHIEALKSGNLVQTDEILMDKFAEIQAKVVENGSLDPNAQKQLLEVFKDIVDQSTSLNTQILTDGFRIGLYPANSPEHQEISREGGTATRMMINQNTKDDSGYWTRNIASKNKAIWSNVQYQDTINNTVVSATRTVGVKTPDGKIVEHSTQLNLEPLGKMTPEQNKEALNFISNMVAGESIEWINIHGKKDNDVEIPKDSRPESVTDALNELKTFDDTQKETLLRIAVNFSYHNNLDLQRALFDR